MNNPKETFFDRQERINWWIQERLFGARILVVGAGALGNEVLKNLALLGVGSILVIDFDEIEDSNLSRSVLFTAEDALDSASKAKVAANRTKKLCPNPATVVKGIHGDVVWELGAGVFRYIDLVLGCLDNLEARLKVNRRCWQAKKVWIDGGMWELSGSVSVYDGSDDLACYECNMTEEDYLQASVRYSCTGKTVKTNLRKGREPTTQTTSALVSALQAQEAVKLLHGLPSYPGRRAIFNGEPHFYLDDEYSPISMVTLTKNDLCWCHAEDRYDDILELSEATANQTTPGVLMEFIQEHTGKPVTHVDLGREFIIASICPFCNERIEVSKPLFKVKDAEVVCPNCEVICPLCESRNKGVPDCANCGHPDIFEPVLDSLHAISNQDQNQDLYLDKPLSEFGIPPLHILKVHDGNRWYKYVELSGDRATLWE